MENTDIFPPTAGIHRLKWDFKDMNFLRLAVIQIECHRVSASTEEGAKASEREAEKS